MMLSSARSNFESVLDSALYKRANQARLLGVCDQCRKLLIERNDTGASGAVRSRSRTNNTVCRQDFLDTSQQIRSGIAPWVLGSARSTRSRRQSHNGARQQNGGKKRLGVHVERTASDLWGLNLLFLMLKSTKADEKKGMSDEK